MTLSRLYQYLLGPKLYSLYSNSVGDTNVKVLAYRPNNLERYGDNILTSIHYASKIILYTSPLILPFHLRRELFTVDNGIFYAKFLVVVCIVGLASIVTRSLGRMTNPLYPNFVDTLMTVQKNYNLSTKAAMERYDFQFRCWPVDFDVGEVEVVKKKVPDYLKSGSTGGMSLSLTDMLARLLTNTFGISLVYPGSMSLMRMVLEGALLEGRCKLVMEHQAVRNKIRTIDKNTIDTMYVNRTKSNTSENGDTLVICCEGNAGFYELGVMSTPLNDGYSVLGWNHPGFGGSSGAPFPEQEKNAADAVMQFALHRLGFSPENIIVMGWSIGGFTSTWLALNYPEIKGLILDATFDHLEPLAIPRMPGFMSPIVRHAVNHHINLDVAGQLRQYSGPLTIIRRLRDEMITVKQLELDTNRGNYLVINLLESRYPNLVNSHTRSNLFNLLGSPLRALDIDMDLQQLLYRSYLQHHDVSNFPVNIGQDMSDDEKTLMLIFLLKQYMKDMDSSHCTPLSASLMKVPWNPFHSETSKTQQQQVDEEKKSIDEQ